MKVPTQTERTRRQGGFTLLELLIAVMILAILAAVVIPSANTAAEEARQAAFVRSLRVFADGASIYFAKTGELLPDTTSGVFPTEWLGYADDDRWEQMTPIAGMWDIEEGEWGIASTMGVHFGSGAGPQPDDEYMTRIDLLIDDGNLATGGFRKFASDRFYYILAN